MAPTEQAGRRRPALRQPTRPLSGFLLVEVGEYLCSFCDPLLQKLAIDERA